MALKYLIALTFVLSVKAKIDLTLDDVTAVVGESFHYRVGDTTFHEIYRINKIVEQGQKKPPDWLQCDLTNGTLTGTPQIADLGSYTLKLRAECINPDTSCQDKVSRTFHINVVEPLKSEESRGRTVVHMHVEANRLNTNRKSGNKTTNFNYPFSMGFHYRTKSLEDSMTYSLLANNSNDIPASKMSVLSEMSLHGSILDVQHATDIHSSSIFNAHNDISLHTSCANGAVSYFTSLLLYVPNMLTFSEMHIHSLKQKLSNFLSKDTEDITVTVSDIDKWISSSSSQYILVAGPGNVIESMYSSVEVTWHLACGHFDSVNDYTRVLQHNINVGRITDEIGYKVIAWFVFTNKPVPLRVKRQAHGNARTATPTFSPPLPTTLSEFLSRSETIPTESFTTSVFSSSDLLIPVSSNVSAVDSFSSLSSFSIDIYASFSEMSFTSFVSTSLSSVTSFSVSDPLKSLSVETTDFSTQFLSESSVPINTTLFSTEVKTVESASATDESLMTTLIFDTSLDSSRYFSSIASSEISYAFSSSPKSSVSSLFSSRSIRQNGTSYFPVVTSTLLTETEIVLDSSVSFHTSLIDKTATTYTLSTIQTLQVLSSSYIHTLFSSNGTGFVTNTSFTISMFSSTVSSFITDSSQQTKTSVSDLFTSFSKSSSGLLTSPEPPSDSGISFESSFVSVETSNLASLSLQTTFRMSDLSLFSAESSILLTLSVNSQMQTQSYLTTAKHVRPYTLSPDTVGISDTSQITPSMSLSQTFISAFGTMSDQISTENLSLQITVSPSSSFVSSTPLYTSFQSIPISSLTITPVSSTRFLTEYGSSIISSPSYSVLLTLSDSSFVSSSLSFSTLPSRMANSSLSLPFSFLKSSISESISVSFDSLELNSSSFFTSSYFLTSLISIVSQSSSITSYTTNISSIPLTKDTIRFTSEKSVISRTSTFSSDVSSLVFASSSQPELETSSLISTASPDQHPSVETSIDHLDVVVGRYFEYKIPKTTFIDKEDGNTRNLTLNISLVFGRQLPKNSWLKFDTDSQMMYGIPLSTDVNTNDTAKIIDRFILIATDSQGQSAKDVISITYRFEKDVTHKIDLNMNSTYFGTSSRSHLLSVAHTLAKFYGDKDLRFLTFFTPAEDSIVRPIVWGNNSLFGENCPTKKIESLFHRIVHENDTVRDVFSTLFLTDPVLSADLFFSGVCMFPVTTLSPATKSPVSESNSDKMWIEIVLPALVAILVIVIIALLLLICCRHRKPRKQVPENDKPMFLEDRRPIIFPEELELLDPSMKPKDPLVLPADYLQETPPAVPQHGRPTPPYRAPAPIDDDFVNDNANSQPQGSVSLPSHQTDPPPYRLPPPYFNPHRVA